MSMIWMMLVAAAPEAIQAAAPDKGVIAYPPSFFAESRPVSAHDMILRVPGFSFDKGASVRGLAGAGGNVLIDGLPPVSKNDALDEILKRIPAGTVERIELIRGGAPGIDMEGRTVLANVVRKQGGGTGFRGVIAPGVYYLRDGRVLPGARFEAQWRLPGGRTAELSQVIAMGHPPNDEYGDGPRVRYNADGSVRLGSDVATDSQGTRYWTTGAFETPLAGGQFRINGAYMASPADVEIYDTYRTRPGLEYERDKIDRTQIELGGRYTRKLTDKVSLETVAFQQFTDNSTGVRFIAPGLTRDFRLDRKTRESVGRLQLRTRINPKLTLETGAEGALNRLDSQTALTVNSRSILVPAANVTVEELRGEAFARGTWRAGRTLTLEAGVRQEASRVSSVGDVTLRKSLTFLKPRASVTWAPGERTQLRVRVEREVGQLNFDDFVASPAVASTGVVVAGNPDLTPQQAWVYEAALERRFWGAGAAVVSYRHYDITDTVDRGPARDLAGAIIRDPLTGLPAADRPDNIGSGTRDEILGSLTLPLDRLGVRSGQLKGQVTWRDTSVVDPLTGLQREISAQHPIDWEAHFSQDLPKFNSVWGADVIGATRERYFRLNEVETRKVSTFVTLFWEYKPRPDWIIRTELYGVTLRDHRRIREVYLGPRNLGRLDYTDIRELEWTGDIYVRVRKIIGG